MTTAVRFEIPMPRDRRWLTRRWVRSVLSCVRTVTDTRPISNLSLVIVSPERIAELDAYYRRAPRVTDVLSFFYPEDGEAEIFICDAVVRRQMIRYGQTAKKEYCRLLVHGTLHTLGYDHLRTSDRARMMPLQDKAFCECARRRIC